MHTKTDHILPVDLEKKTTTIQGQEEQTMKTKPALRSRSLRSPVLIILVICAFLYTISPMLSAASTAMVPSIRSSTGAHPRPIPNICTAAIGEGLCCQLHLEAEPCLDECRRSFTDRQTFRPTAQFDECASGCLFAYEGSCGDRKIAP